MNIEQEKEFYINTANFAIITIQNGIELRNKRLITAMLNTINSINIGSFDLKLKIELRTVIYKAESYLQGHNVTELKKIKDEKQKPPESKIENKNTSL